MALGAGLLALASAAACSDERLHVELPPEGDARAALLAVESRGAEAAWRLERLVAVDLGAPAGEDLYDVRGKEAGRALRLTVLYYAEPLDALALAPGPLEIAPAEPTRVLPETSRISARVVSSTVSEGWRPLTVLPPSLASVRISAEALYARLCAPPEVRAYPVEEGPALWNSAFAVAVGPWALAGDEGGGLRLLSKDGLVRAVTTTATVWSARPWPGDEGHSLLAAGTGGRIWRAVLDEARLELDLEPWGEDASAGRIYRADAGLGPEGLEVFTISKEGTFGRWIDGRFTALASFRPTLDARPRTGVKWLGPGEGAAFYWTSNVLARFTGGRAVSEVVAETDGRVLTAYDVVPRLGEVVADEAGEVFARDGRAWRRLGDWGFGEPFEIDAVAPWNDGLLAVGRNGLAALLDPHIGFCPADNVGPSTLLQLVPWGDELLAVAEHSPSKTKRTFLRITPR